MFNILEAGSSFEPFLKDIRFQAILESPMDAYKIKHLAQRYASSSKMFDFEFNKTVTATDHDLIIKVDKHTSSQLLQIKNGSDFIIASKGSMLSGKKIEMRIPKG